MSPHPLPERPNLDHLKKLAKTLLRDAQAGQADALARFAALPAFGASVNAADLALHDAQSAIAREHGFPSWNALREEVEARTLSFEAAVDEFVRAATGGAPDRARRLLKLYPKVASASLHTALVLGDAAAVDARLREQPALATAPGGPHGWEPLLYVCHTSLHRDDEARAAGLVTIARTLCTMGANPNGEYHWDWHPELPRTALWGALCAMRHLPLAEVLLEAGARTTDGVSTHIAAGFGDVAALDLLYRYAMDVNGQPGGVPPLPYILTWGTNPDGPRWLLEHGADANRAWGPDDEAPLHVAARRWDVPMVEALVRHGADVTRPRADGATPYRLAALSGNAAVAAWFEAHGAATELPPIERFVAACARGDAAAADAMLAAQPGLRDSLREGHHLLLQHHAESGHVAALETMLTRGFDPAVTDKDGVTALHRAAMAGYADAVAVLLRHGAPVNALDGMFSATPLVWAVEGRNNPGPSADHVRVARLLIAAGSPVDWTPPPAAPQKERTLEGLRDLRRAAAD